MLQFPPLDPAPKKFAVNGPPVVIGCDPEIFATDKLGRVIGSDRILPKIKAGLVVRDGVQFELHPIPTTCRANVINSLKDGILEMQRQLEAKAKGSYKISFKQLVSVSKRELLGLSEDARTLGCAPSKNIYGHKTPEIDGMVYRKRTGAGHIHMGVGLGAYKIDEKRLVKLLDIVVGNTCVLLDRGTAAAVERRRNYGKAGEYRLPDHGIEYRTPSNFWLRAAQLFSLVSALSRTSVRLASSPYFRGNVKNPLPSNGDWDIKLLEGISDEQIQHSINANDYDAALDIYLKWVRPMFWETDGYEGVYHENLKDFDFFLSRPVEKWFPTDPLIHWQNTPEGHGCGWENFLQETVRPHRLGAEALEAPAGAAKILIEGVQ